MDILVSLAENGTGVVFAEWMVCLTLWYDLVYCACHVIQCSCYCDFVLLLMLLQYFSLENIEFSLFSLIILLLSSFQNECCIYL